MECGQEIRVKDINGSNVMRFIAQCEGRFLLITWLPDWRNGYMLPNWQAVLRELIAQAVPAKLTERLKTAESMATGLYVSFPLTYPLSAQELANLVGVPVADVRAELDDLTMTEASYGD